MVQKVTWSLAASADGGPSLSGGGVVEAEAVTLASRRLEPAMGAQVDLALQLADVAGVEVLVIDSSLRDGSVEVQGDGAAATKLTGPLLLFGEAVALFSGDLTTLRAQNTHADTAVDLSILIGRSLSTAP